MSPMDKHYDEMTVLLYHEGQLDAAHAEEISAHLASCAACRGLLHALEAEEVWLREALTAHEESIPARLAHAPGRRTAHWGWITAFALSAGGVYTLWTGFVDPWVAQAQQAGFTQGSLLTMLFFTGAFSKGWDAMRTLMEFLAMATLGSVVIWLLRKHWKRFPMVAAVMGALACALALPPSARAAEVRRGDPSYTLSAGQEVKTDLIVFAARTRIDGDVDGDLIVWSQSVIVNGHVKGDILGFAQSLTLNGPVDGNVRAWAQSTSLNGTIAKNAMIFSEQMDFDEKANVGGTMTLFSANAELDGHLGGDLMAAGGVFDIDGSLGNNASIRAGRLSIGPHAEIKGHTKYSGRRQPDVSPGAKLGSPIETTIVKRGPNYSRPGYYWHQMLMWGASFLFGLVVLLAVPAFFSDVVQGSKRIGPALGFGVLFVFATPIAAIIACITIVGLGVGIAALLLYVIALYSAQVFIGSWLGEKLLGVEVGVGAAIGRLALGLAVLRALHMLPYAGPLIGLIVVIWGVGALSLALYKRFRPQSPAAA
ncbi:MAG TPA: zf-HC2 domain-containing protein [Candidatus Polarisedimenticolia bacterium]|nr:zf-HC2 domain-containing protein [Candidatus Polarisedimenticolia bacterium]